jgi:hypothetical protein
MEYYTSRIFELYTHAHVDKVDTYTRREIQYMHNLPDEYISDIVPTMLNGKMKFKTSNGLLPDALEQIALNNNEVQHKVLKLNDELTKRKTPTQILREFKEQYLSNLSSIALQNFNSIIEKSKNWN